jgi:hypothetical protein
LSIGEANDLTIDEIEYWAGRYEGMPRKRPPKPGAR